MGRVNRALGKSAAGEVAGSVRGLGVQGEKLCCQQQSKADVRELRAREFFVRHLRAPDSADHAGFGKKRMH